MKRRDETLTPAEFHRRYPAFGRRKAGNVTGRRSARQMEHEMQTRLFAWASSGAARRPELALLYAVPNGGTRHQIEAARMKGAGVRAGVPDVCLPVPRGPFGALYLELKHGENDVTRAQDAWLRRLHDAGNAVTVVYSFEHATAAIDEYLTDPEHFISGP